MNVQKWRKTAVLLSSAAPSALAPEGAKGEGVVGLPSAGEGVGCAVS